MNANDTTAIVNIAKASSANATNRATVKKPQQQNEVKTTLTKADSAFYFNNQPDFVSLCTEATDFYTHNENQSLRSSVQSNATPQADTAKQHSEVTIPQPTPRGHSALDGFVKVEFIGVAVILLLLAIIKASSATFIGEIINFFTNGIKWRKLTNTISARTSLLFFLTMTIYHISACMFIVEATTILFNKTAFGFGITTIACIAAYAIWNISRLIADRIVGFAFNIDEKSKTIILYKNATCAILGLLLTPITFTLPFISTTNSILLIYITIAAIAIATTYRVIRVAQLFMNNLSSFFYMFLYLCIVEAMPIVFLCKLAMLVANDITT